MLGSNPGNETSAYTQHHVTILSSTIPCMDRIPNGNGTTNILNDHIQLMSYGFTWMLVKLTKTYVMIGPYYEEN